MGKEEKARKQIPLRLSAGLYAELSRWAEDDFRSLNGQIEYLLTQCVRHRRGKAAEEDADGTEDADAPDGSE